MGPNRGLIALVLVTVAALCSAGETVVVDDRYKDGCGPISCLVALRSLGFEASLTQLCDECRWQEGTPVRIGDMEAALNSHPGIECVSARLKPRGLVECLWDRQTAVILVLAKNSKTVNHAVCAVAVNDSDEIMLVDYPELVQVKTLGEIVSNWDGTALVVRPSPMYRVLDKTLLYVVPCLAIMLLVSAFRFRKKPKKQQ